MPSSERFYHHAFWALRAVTITAARILVRCIDKKVSLFQACAVPKALTEPLQSRALIRLRKARPIKIHNLYARQRQRSQRPLVTMARAQAPSPV